MLFKLITSAVLTAAAFVGLYQAGVEPDSGGNMVFYALAAVMMGYHRNLSVKKEAPGFAEVVIATEERMGVSTSIWGMPLTKPRMARIRSASLQFAAKNPSIARLIECLPQLLRGPVNSLFQSRVENR